MWIKAPPPFMQGGVVARCCALARVWVKERQEKRALHFSSASRGIPSPEVAMCVAWLAMRSCASIMCDGFIEL